MPAVVATSIEPARRAALTDSGHAIIQCGNKASCAAIQLEDEEHDEHERGNAGLAMAALRVPVARALGYFS